MKLSTISVIAGITLLLSNTSFADGTDVPYPEGYRNWFHVKTMLIESGHQLENPFQGIHHVYANEKAKQGLKTGKYSDGAEFAFDLLKYSEKSLTIQEGDRKLLGVMYKDSSMYSSTGGWGFEGFSGSSKSERLVNDGGKSCYSCHTSVKKTNYVFSQIRK